MARGQRLTERSIFFISSIIMLNSILLQITQAVTAPFCIVSIWALLVGLFWAIGVAVQDGVQRLKRLHQVPCDRCLYFTGDYRLKCTIHPCKALTEEAIGCRDYELTSRHPTTICSKDRKLINL
jgi:hypothetical protein